ncbi:MAG: ATP-dependent DNA ligase [Candidatus Anstonellales archaeon]
MLFREVVTVLESIERTRSRLEITSALAELFKKTNPEEAKYLSYLLTGYILPPYYGVETGIGIKMLFDALSIASGYKKEEIEKEYKKINEIGLLAYNVIEKKKQKTLLKKEMDLSYVYKSMLKIAMLSGKGSAELKKRYTAELFNNASKEEAKYIARILLAEIRAGIGEPTILDALSWALKGTKELRDDIERAYNLCSDIGIVAETALKSPDLIKTFEINIFRPIRPALAERLASAEEIYKKIGTCAIEYKYDGFRMQVHKKNNEVAIFSRRLERMKGMFPDIEQSIKLLEPDELIIEGEALAYDQKQGRFFSFQETMHRRRKYGIEQASKQYPLKLFLFDIMYLNGKDLTREPFKKRREILEKAIAKRPGNIEISTLKIAKNAGEIENMFNDAIKRGLEGIMAKDLNAPYIAGKREFAWIKLKKSYGKEIDTIDAVVAGYYYGTGARAKFGFGGLLVCIYNEETDKFETIAKASSGFTEQELVKFKKMLEEIETDKPDERVVSLIKPDKWVKLKYVVEVMYDEITLSKQHTAGMQTESGKGFALRFPRFFKLREDKDIYEATTLREIESLFYAQKSKAGKKA